jgi:predicted N-acetyltransferase YhbS
MTAAAALPSVQISPEAPGDANAVEALVTAAFGPGRFAKTAERLREQAASAGGFVARQNGRLVGSVRLWRISVGDRPAAFLGPIAVDAAFRGGGLGADLVQAAVAQARNAGVSGVLLVGDAPYFARFGFAVADRVRLPGPVDPRRVHWLGFDGAAAEGPVSA